MKQRPHLIGNPSVRQIKTLNKDALDLERAATQAFNTKTTRLISQSITREPNVLPINPPQSFPIKVTTNFLIYPVDEDNMNTSQEMWTL